MERLNLVLFGVGYVFSSISLIIMLVKLIKNNKIGIIMPLMLIIGITSLGFGVWLTKLNPFVLNNDNNTSTAAAKTTTANTQIEPNQTKNGTFDANGSVIPKTEINEWSNKIITDADGSKTILETSSGTSGIIITPEGIRIFKPGGVIVQVPENKSTPDGKLYRWYGYGKDEVLGEIHIATGLDAVPRESSTYSKIILGSDKEDIYPIGGKYDMSLIDFVYQVIPSKIAPKNTITNSLLSGSYIGKDEKILETITTMSIDILDDKLLEFKCNYISGMDSIYGYKIEELGKNAYKLYLYPATVKADSNGGGTSISQEPIKRTFIIYMKSKDSFDIVFISDDIKRTSISMSRQ